MEAQLQEAWKYRLALSMLPGAGPVTQRNIIQYFGEARAFFEEPAAKLIKVPGVGPLILKNRKEFKEWKTVEKEITFMENRGIRPVFINDPSYPSRLKQIPDAPLVIYQKGNYNLHAKRNIAIVGTRKSSQYGKEVTENLIRELGKADVTIISGLAYGIDTYAHTYACKAGIPNIAVLGHGLDQIYPKANYKLAQHIQENGALLTEYPSGTAPDRENFPARNRIVAGMCDALIVIETGVKGGAMITADLAFQYDREVFAVPGKITDPLSEGCNMLIRSTKAYCYESPEMLLSQLGWNSDARPQVRPTEALDIFERSIVEKLRTSGQMHIDVLSAEAGMPGPELSLLLLDLELKGFLRAIPGKFFKAA